MSNLLLWPWSEEKSYAWMDEVLTRALPAGIKRAWPVSPGLMDGKYWTVSKEEFEYLLAWDWTNQASYIAERRDCDQYAEVVRSMFSWRLGINSVGLVLDVSSAHAYNLVVFSDATWGWLEPQSDSWVQLGSGLYKLTEGSVMI